MDLTCIVEEDRLKRNNIWKKILQYIAAPCVKRDIAILTA
jgi:hypothetical protein